MKRELLASELGLRYCFTLAVAKEGVERCCGRNTDGYSPDYVELDWRLLSE